MTEADRIDSLRQSVERAGWQWVSRSDPDRGYLVHLTSPEWLSLPFLGRQNPPPNVRALVWNPCLAEAWRLAHGEMLDCIAGCQTSKVVSLVEHRK